jgi:hypothetical protein
MGPPGVAGWNVRYEDLAIPIDTNFSSAAAFCAETQNVLGGGYILSPYDTELRVVFSRPFDEGKGWWVAVSAGSGGSSAPAHLEVWAICADVS